MHKLKLIIIFFLFFGAIGSAQVQPVSERISISGFGSLNIDFRTFENNLAFYSGGGGGFIIQDFRLGVFFEGLTGMISRGESNIPDGISTSNGGLWLIYPFYGRRDYHPTIDLRLCYGDVRFMDTNIRIIDNADFLGFAIGFGIEYKLSDIVFLNSGIKYYHNFFLREFRNPDLFENFSFDQFNAVGIYVALKIGTFFPGIQ